MRVLLTDYAWPDLEIERRHLSAAGVELIVADSSDEGTLSELARRHAVDAIMACWAPITAAVIGASPRCRIVARLGIGLDNIDLDFCTRHGILVTNVPDYCVTEVAEHTIALLLAFARRIADYHLQTQQGSYHRDAVPAPLRIAGRTLGLVGFGRIAKAVAERASALGLRVLVVNRSSIPTGSGVQQVDLETLLAESDFVSLHVPLTEETRHLMNADRLARMRPTACLINTARGGLIDHRALAEAIQQERLAGAALDVQDPEPPDLSQPPYCDRRVIVTPHAAFLSDEAVRELRQRCVQQVLAALEGATPENIVNRK